MPRDPLFWLMQANDSQYPSGSYAHSLGLEELVECGVVATAADLEEFLESQVLPALLVFEVPYFALAHAAAAAGDVEKLAALDGELDAWRLAEETRQASRMIGGRRLDLLKQLDGAPIVADYARAGAPCHHLVITALELRELPCSHAARAFAFQCISGFATASMKLIRIGQTACHGIIRRILEKAGPGVDMALDRAPDGWFNPLLEIASLRHARAHARLFIS